MVNLPDPSKINRKIASPGGVSGQLRGSMVPDIAPDTAIADTLGKISDEAHKFQMKEKARMDQVAFDDAKNQYMQQALVLKKEVSGIKGKEAVDRDIDKEYMTKLDGISESISSSLKNNSQRDAWNSYSGTAKVQFRTGVMKHKLSESDSYAQTTNTATIATNQTAAISNPSNGRIVQESADSIKVSVARELVRTGNAQDPDIVKYEMNKALVPLWHGVIKAQIDNGKYGTATELLEEKKELLGKNYGNLINYMKDKEGDVQAQVHRDEIYNKFDTWEERLSYARSSLKGDMEEKVTTKLKTLKNEETVFKADKKNKQTEHDVKWMSDKGVDLLNSRQLTISGVENAGLSDENEMLWKNKVYNQDAQTAKMNAAAMADMSKNTYADLSVKISLDPERFTEDDLAKFVGPNTGGLNGPQYRTLRDDLKKAKEAKAGTGTTSAKQESRGTTLLKSMYDRGDFGKVKTGKDKYNTDSWKIFSDSLVDYKQKFREDPEGDHRQWLDDRVQEEGEKILTKMLDADWKAWPFGDDSVEITKKFLKERGIEPTEENIKAHLEDKGVAPEEKPEASTKNTKTIKAKIMKRTDGSHYILYPNGTKKEATVDKDGKVSF